MVILLFILLFNFNLFAIMDGVNTGIRDINIYGIFEKSSDNLNSLNCNPASIVNNLSDRYLAVNITEQFVKNKEFHFLPYSFVIGGNITQSQFYFGVGNIQYIYYDSFEDSSTEVNKINFTIALPDNISGINFNAGISINYYKINRKIENNIIKGNGLSIDWGILKNFNKFGIGFSWHNGSKVNWEVNTILDNEINSSFIFHTYVRIYSFDFILGWIHIFDLHHRNNGESTKNLVLRKSENRLNLGIIVPFMSNLKLKFGIYNINNFYNEDIIEKNSIQFVSIFGINTRIQKISINMTYQDSNLISSPKGYESVNNFTRVIISIGYSFGKGE